ncbi:MAG: hypothetical protein ABSA11_17045 [Candidatus Bathyarchaeia archaeon]|jgi:hypothetical protein
MSNKSTLRPHLILPIDPDKIPIEPVDPLKENGSYRVTLNLISEADEIWYDFFREILSEEAPSIDMFTKFEGNKVTIETLPNQIVANIQLIKEVVEKTNTARDNYDREEAEKKERIQKSHERDIKTIRKSLANIK